MDWSGELFMQSHYATQQLWCKHVKMICNSSGIDFIHGHIHGRLSKKSYLFSETRPRIYMDRYTSRNIFIEFVGFLYAEIDIFVKYNYVWACFMYSRSFPFKPNIYCLARGRYIWLHAMNSNFAVLRKMILWYFVPVAQLHSPRSHRPHPRLAIKRVLPSDVAKSLSRQIYA